MCLEQPNLNTNYGVVWRIYKSAEKHCLTKWSKEANSFEITCICMVAISLFKAKVGQTNIFLKTELKGDLLFNAL